MTATVTPRRPVRHKRLAPAAGSGSEDRVGGDVDAVTIAATMATAAMSDGLGFCDEKYQETYHSHWVARPDILFVARKRGCIVSTAALELGSKRPQIDSERYFLLSPGMRTFIDDHRTRLAEFGRFASEDQEGTKAVIHAAVAFMRQAGIEFFFAWANPSVYSYVAHDIGLPLCAIEVPVNETAVRADTTWTVPPVDFFIREDAPHLLVGVVPFLDVANTRFATEYGAPLDLMM
jgi:hypothetical protein